MGRGVSCLLGACAFVVAGVLTPNQAFAAIDIPTIALLTGCMMLSAHAEKAGLHVWLTRALASGATPLSLLIRISIVSALSSALITNDTTCIVLTPLVVDAARSARRSPLPFLVALATAANIGSALSPVGNPQNMIIAMMGKLRFFQFLYVITLASILGLILNAFVIMKIYSLEMNTQLILDGDMELPNPKVCPITAAVQVKPQGSPITTAALGKPEAKGMLHPITSEAPIIIIAQPAPTTKTATSAAAHDAATVATATANRRRQIILGILSIVPLFLIFADLWIGLVWAVLLAAALVFAIDGEPPAPLLARVDANLLFFFAGLFICTAGLNATGLPAAAWAALAPYASLDNLAGLAVFTTLVVVGSNTVSNVPLVLLLAPALTTLSAADARRACLVLAWTSTVGGNFTLLGAVANVIVAERARAEGVSMTFFGWLRAGVPSTVLILFVGTPLVWMIANLSE